MWRGTAFRGSPVSRTVALANPARPQPLRLWVRSGGGSGHQPTAITGILDLRSLRDLAAGLAGADFTLHVRSGDRLLLLAGRDAKTGILSRLLRLPRVQLNPRFAFRSALGRGHPGP